MQGQVKQEPSLTDYAPRTGFFLTSTNPKHPNKPWFDDDCIKAIAERKSVFRQFNLRPTQENLSKFKIARAKARRTIKQSKRASWRQ